MMEFTIHQVVAAPPRRLVPWDSTLFAMAREEHAPLAPFRSPAALSARLKVQDADTAERIALAHSLVELYQQDPCPLWSELLVRSYAPLLLGLRSEVRLGRLQHHDVDQLLLATFLHRAASVDLSRTGDFVTRSLARDVRRDLFRVLTRERRTLAAEASVPRQLASTVSIEQVEARAVWSSLQSAYDNAPPLEHIVLAHEGGLRQLVHQTAKGSKQEREQQYDRERKTIERFAKLARASVESDLSGAPPPPRKRRARRGALH